MGELSVVLFPVALMLVCLFYSASSVNSPATGVPFLFIASGLAAWSARHWLWRMPVLKTSAARKGRRILRLGLMPCMILVTAFDVWNFRTRFNDHPTAHDLDRPSAAGLGEVVSYFKSKPGNFFLLGDSSELYAMTGRPSVNPAIWFGRDLNAMLEDPPRKQRFEDAIRSNLLRHEVKFVVIEGNRTRSGVGLHEFGFLQKSISGCPSVRFKAFVIAQICRGTEK
jgi:hypothetical protein